MMHRQWRAAWALAAVVGVGAAVASGQAAQKPTEPSAPASQLKPRVGTPDNPFPPVNPRNFTAATPTAETVNKFLQVLWGYSDNRVWSVAAIQKTTAPGVARVVVFVADKRQPGKAARSIFFTTPDGEHVIADAVLPFGEQPFLKSRKLMQDRANGPAQGATAKDLLIVEFAGLQCANCAAAHEKLEQLQQDFPQARFVFENVPQPDAAPLDPRAAALGVCVREQKGDVGFYSYLKYIYGHQSVMTPASGEATMQGAITSAGADPAVATKCADTQKTRDAVQGPVDLALDAGVDGQPMALINGRLISLAGIDYESLKQIVVFQAGLDGVPVKVQPTLKTLK